MRSRWHTIYKIASQVRRIAAGGVVLSFAIPVLQWWRDEGPTNHQPPLGADVFGWMPWWAWLIVSLVGALAVLFEAAHREITSLERQMIVKRDRVLVSNLYTEGKWILALDEGRHGSDWTYLAQEKIKSWQPRLAAAISDGWGYPEAMIFDAKGWPRPNGENLYDTIRAKLDYVEELLRRDDQGKAP